MSGKGSSFRVLSKLSGFPKACQGCPGDSMQDASSEGFPGGPHASSLQKKTALQGVDDLFFPTLEPVPATRTASTNRAGLWVGDTEEATKREEEQAVRKGPGRETHRGRNGRRYKRHETDRQGDVSRGSGRGVCTVNRRNKAGQWNDTRDPPFSRQQAGRSTRLPGEAQSVSFAAPQGGALAAQPVVVWGCFKTYGNFQGPGVQKGELNVAATRL